MTSLTTRWGRPELYTSYRQDMALLNTRSKVLGTVAVLVVAAMMPMLVSDNMLIILGSGLVLAIGAIGLNLVTGYAGQVSLGHAFFVGIGAYAAAVLSGDPDGRYLGLGVDFMPFWLIGAGLVAAIFGALVAPLATRLRGLYLAVVTLGLVFIGQYFFFEWNEMSGGPQVGREAARPELFGIQFTVDNGFKGGWTEEQKLYWLFLGVLVVAAVLARNIARSRIGRAFSAIRDRDVAAGVMGVNLTRYKIVAFTISSFYAGICGALMFSASGHFTPESFSLLMSVQFIAIVLIGGVATISGTIMGAMLIALLPRLASELPAFVPFLSSSASEHPNIFEFEQIMYGVLIVAFLLFEPRGLFGIWHRIRTYWKSFPFSY
ncbi:MULTISPECIES: branched-chain amino acid ABC transporter permease [unclassified Nocardioides]|uniref:branched-chain amino acid ABC transporter permease n=1 Tax=unclassified Nocardioides TaxID=2615069 RepID=UPI0006F8BBB1|nr:MULTISPECIES: branched-chain amino acid ABC transporter permease [unclassified Nocardioides]KRA38653.1 branched-chain amino acid ABC transporter permease [Nocardioides sp. Root614]KRA92613.1 branched-chain amino acid ABC transporter permease [Nocardioides sp. Root682]